MSHPRTPGGLPEGGGDPWSAFGYLVAGVGVYGLLGWLLGRWLNAPFLLPVGIVLGAVLGLVLVYYQLGRVPGASTDDGKAAENSSANDPEEPGPAPPGPPPGQSTDDDRGETE